MFTGDTVFTSGAATTPIEVLRSMTEHGKQKQLRDIRVCSIHTEFESPYSAPECKGVLSVFSIKFYIVLTTFISKFKKYIKYINIYLYF